MIPGDKDTARLDGLTIMNDKLTEAPMARMKKTGCVDFIFTYLQVFQITMPLFTLSFRQKVRI